MEEKENIIDGNKNKKIAWCIASIIIIVLIGSTCYLLYNIKEKPVDISNDGSVNNIEENKIYLTILDGKKKILKSNLNLTKSAKINSSKEAATSSIVLLDIVEPDFQFETHYLLCFDKEGKLIFEARDFNDVDNDNNRYKFNGKFEYDDSKNILTFYTNLFLGDGEESTGTAFNDKVLSDLTNAEKNTLGNYSDEVKYEYIYENEKMNFIEKSEISKLKNNIYYKELLND